MAIKAFKRCEKKYLLTQVQYDELLPRLLEYMDLDHHCQDGKNYSIHNIYYDTENDDVIRHSISKPYYKEKLRLRSYKIPKNPSDKVFLELKKKIGGVVNKRRAVMTLEQSKKFLENGERPQLKDYISNQVLDEIEYYLEKNKVKPKVYVSYSRNALFGKEDRDFRLTFDSHILTRREDLYLESGEYGEELLAERPYLMEVKILGALPLWAVKAFSELKIYSCGFSKYGNEFQRYCLEKRKNKCTRYYLNKDGDKYYLDTEKKEMHYEEEMRGEKVC